MEPWRLKEGPWGEVGTKTEGERKERNKGSRMEKKKRSKVRRCSVSIDY